LERKKLLVKVRYKYQSIDWVKISNKIKHIVTKKWISFIKSKLLINKKLFNIRKKLKSTKLKYNFVYSTKKIKSLKKN
jgi:hypothetical protein